MEKQTSIHRWARSGASVYVARITSVDVKPSGPGEQTTTLGIHIEQALFGPRGAEARTAAVVEPASVTARLKFPAPVWGALKLMPGTWFVLTTAELGPEVKEPMFARPLTGPDDPSIGPLRQLLAAESQGEDATTKRGRYLKWLRAGGTLERLFAADAFTLDEDLPDVDARGEVAAAFAAALGSERDPLVRSSLVARAFPSVFDRSNEVGKVALLQALFRAAADTEIDVRRAAVDALSETADSHAALPGLGTFPDAAPAIEERLLEETDAPTKARLRKWLQTIR